MTNDNKKILIIGATGLLGKPVTKAFIERGHAVRVLSRSPARAKQVFGDKAEVVQGNVLNKKDLQEALEGCTGLYINLKSGKNYDYAQSDEINGVKNIIEIIADKELEFLSYISGSGDFAKHLDQPPAKIKHSAEQMIESSGKPFVIFKPTHFMESLPLFVVRGRINVVGKQPHKIHYLAAKDYAQFVVDTYEDSSKRNKKILCLGPDAYSMKEALTIFSNHCMGGMKVGIVRLWFLGLMGKIFKSEEIKTIKTLFTAFKNIPESGGPDSVDETWQGTTDLDTWCADQPKLV